MLYQLSYASLHGWICREAHFTTQNISQPGQTLSLTQRQYTCKHTTRWVATAFLRAGDFDSPLPPGTELGFCGARSDQRTHNAATCIVQQIAASGPSLPQSILFPEA